MCDLDFTAANYPDAKIYYGQNPNNPNEFVITFWHAHRKYAVVPTIPEYVTFQIILTKNKNYPFKIQYNAAESTSPLPSNITDLCTIGAENSDGTNGILYRRLSNFGTMFDKNNSLAFEAKLKDTTIVKLNAKVFLQNVDVVTGVMGDFFHAVNSFPLSDPYAVPGAFSGTFAHVNNGSIKTTTTAILTVNNSWGDPNAIEDWVFIELRKGLPGATTVAHTQAALLQFDGDIVDTDGISPVPFPTALPDKYYVTIRHRNHLTPNTVLNLTNNTVPLYGATPQIQLSPTIYAMNAGDSNSDGSIDAFDTILWQIFNGTFGNYQDTSDYNLDGSVDAFDSIFWEINNGKFAEYE
jgi:hypothetical protein